MVNLPLGVDISNLIDDLRDLSWESADILLYYSKMLKDSNKSNEIIKTNFSDDPVTVADLSVNELVLRKMHNKYPNIKWNYLSEENVKSKINYFENSSEWTWVLDPLDGTKDFIQGTKDYAMHFALNYRNKPYLGVVLIPERDELWIANGDKVWCENRSRRIKKFNLSNEYSLNKMTLVTSKNHSNKALKELIDVIPFKNIIVMGSIGCKISSILRGESDIYISLSLPTQSSPKDWDFAGPEVILITQGGSITDINNIPLSYNNSGFEQKGLIVASNNKSKHKGICDQIKEIIQKHQIFPL